MAGLFNLLPRARSPKEATFAIDLDPREPYLDDHRPGGTPLFPTVMGIEVCVIGAQDFIVQTVGATVSCIDVHKPFVLQEGKPSTIELSVVRSDDEAKIDCRCALFSTQGGHTALHLEATVQFDSKPNTICSTRLPSDSRKNPHPSGGPLVKGTQVYELFFHGPSYQVIYEAEFQAGEMLCTLNSLLPASHRSSSADSAMAPRLIEFALQSAGLLEIATNGRMMIPHSIECIDRLVAADVTPLTAMQARAAYRPGDDRCIDIEILDESERAALLVRGYRTVDLPFALPADRVARLQKQLRSAELD